MKTSGINFRHLYFFRVVAAEGSVTRAAERLGLAIQTISAQLAALEQSVGKQLLTQQGRRLVPTEAGRVALTYAEQIFELGDRMQEALNEADAGRTRLTVGISDSLPKLIAYRLLRAAFNMKVPVKLVCVEREFESLLADLALHKLDVVLTDRSVRASASLRVYNHLLGESEMLVFGTKELVHRLGGNFPRNLNQAPMLLPTRNNALRGRIDEWLLKHDVRPEVVGEFEDNAMLTTFARDGLGLFFAPAGLEPDIQAQYGAVPAGAATELREQFYAISSERRIKHPAVEAIMAANTGLFTV
ncbi:LysR family transcriptional regulator [Pseudoduganella albidiflava]|uniref:LysR family transcriptional regulator n=1 Tax=Pseudoduganella albidiflava TaxID=321983 RepID=A0A411X3T6_9BURK|nr:LysR family transcriptional regulator [Pseudoduganella albidiflava]QBI03532.1 LysR family transcriptional regulator [Pseudoduganella albidiflava]GGY50797.1 transcriptional activator NhaR [Pseudoduganella albidiflava]